MLFRSVVKLMQRRRHGRNLGQRRRAADLQGGRTSASAGERAWDDSALITVSRAGRLDRYQ